jgi:hypothetical protein
MTEEAHAELFGLRHMAAEVAYLNGERFRPCVARLLWNCDYLRRYLWNNTDALINYGARYRSKLPISISRAEGCVDEIANARMARKQQMRWSPQGAHRVATVRAAVLDRRFGTAELALASLTDQEVRSPSPSVTPASPKALRSRSRSYSPLKQLPKAASHCRIAWRQT